MRSLKQENAAFKTTVSRLISQISGSAVSGAAPGVGQSKAAASPERLQAYHARRVNDYVNGSSPRSPATAAQ
jgi:hypothetical protein